MLRNTTRPADEFSGRGFPGFPDNGMVATTCRSSPQTLSHNSAAIKGINFLSLRFVKKIPEHRGSDRFSDLGESFQVPAVNQELALASPAVAGKAALKLRRDSDCREIPRKYQRFRRQLHPSPGNDHNLGAMPRHKALGPGESTVR